MKNCLPITFCVFLFPGILLIVLVPASADAVQPTLSRASGTVCDNVDDLASESTSQSLAGLWRFDVDPDDQGVRDLWAARSLKKTIRLPGTTDEAGVGEQGPERNGVLMRRHEYIGPAWYQRDIDIPDWWAGMEIRLFLQRVLWQSRVWIDGREVGKALDSWATPHVHSLGNLAPGRHTLTLRVDNRLIHPMGTMSHSYGPETQTRWNGAVGTIELQAIPEVHIKQSRLFTQLNNGRWMLKVETTLSGRGTDAAMEPLTVSVRILDPKSDTVVLQCQDSIDVGAKSHVMNLRCGNKVKAWSEFSPELYQAAVCLERRDKVLDRHVERFGFRDIAHHGNQLLLNNQPIFVRGNLDCVHFPLTGYPSTKVDDWLRVFRIYKSHNLNHVRFHSWCPPDAAFQAADLLGIYIQAEAGVWINEATGRGEGMGPGKNDRSVDTFIQAEMRCIVDTFGNHPSFVLMAIGNELGHSNFEVTGQWIKAIKQYDPRRLYAASTARTITPYCDFNATHSVPGIGMVRQHMEPGTDWDYEKQYSRTSVPIIAHEVGQWPVYPKWSVIDKFQGVLRNTRLEAMRRQAEEAGILEQQADFTRASGAVNAMLYKDEIDSFLRTRSCRGFQLLSMQDFQGQGEAYVGWLDMFWDSKGTTDPARFRGYCAPVVALARIPKYVWRSDETIQATMLLRNDGPTTLTNTTVRCRIVDTDGASLYKTSFAAQQTLRDELVVLGKIQVPWRDVIKSRVATRLTLELAIDGKADRNTYPMWVYPAELPKVDASKIVLASEWDKQTIAALESGATVLLDAHQLGDPDWAGKLARWRPLYWSLVFFPGQTQTLGLLVQDDHAALRHFPTEYFDNWQWWNVCHRGHGFDITHIVPANYRPIAQPVPDFHASRKIGTIFECKVGKGKLLVCGYDLSQQRCRRHAAVAQLRYSLLKYVTGSTFSPAHEISAESLSQLFPKVETAAVTIAPRFAAASFYLDAAGRHAQRNQHVPYSKTLDKVITSNGFSYDVSGIDGMWKDNHVTAWIIGRKKATLTLQTPKAAHGQLFIHFSDWNKNHRRGMITVEGGRMRLRLAAHDKEPTGVWIKMDILREDTLDRQVTVTFQRTEGSNLMVTDVVFVPSSE